MNERKEKIIKNNENIDVWKKRLMREEKNMYNNQR